jgi:predicted membrane protein
MDAMDAMDASGYDPIKSLSRFKTIRFTGENTIKYLQALQRYAKALNSLEIWAFNLKRWGMPLKELPGIGNRPYEQ